ncbi:MAG: UDP-glucose 4-epimerase GalE [Bacteroidota bacterium]
MSQTILVTGGLGYIGSHTVVELMQQGYQVVIADNLSNAQPFIASRIAAITGTKPVWYKKNLCNIKAVRQLFANNRIDVVIHFAAHKSVAESVQQPLKYFSNNLQSLMNVLQVMQEAAVKPIVFSSSATVYGYPDVLPVTETAPFKPALSAYASTKQMGEELLQKICAAGSIQNISLRYFNPVGAHPSGLIGELPTGIPNNLLPYVTQTAAGKLKMLTVYGNDYDTPDGTCIRDYIHVVDLAKAHVKACSRLLNQQVPISFEVFNIGTGKGTSVLQMIQQFERVTGISLNYKIGKRRLGDAPAVYAGTEKANTILGWRAALSLSDMIASAWQWQLQLAK